MSIVNSHVLGSFVFYASLISAHKLNIPSIHCCSRKTRRFRAQYLMVLNLVCFRDCPVYCHSYTTSLRRISVTATLLLSVTAALFLCVTYLSQPHYFFTSYICHSYATSLSCTSVTATLFLYVTYLSQRH